MKPNHIRITINKGTAEWLKWRHSSDLQRDKFRAEACRRMIILWKTVKLCTSWTPLTDLAPQPDSYRRWLRRNLYTFANAGLVEIKRVPRVGNPVYFRKSR